MQTIKEKKISWIDIIKPTRKDIEQIKKTYKIHPIILEEILNPSIRSQIETYNNYLFLTYHIPTYDPILKTSRKAEIDFLITKDTVITAHYEELGPLNEFLKKINSSAQFKSTTMANTGTLIHSIIEEINNFSIRQLRHIEENITKLNHELFMGKEEKMLKEISYVKRDLLDYRLITHPQELTLKSLKEIGKKFWNQDVSIYLNDLISDHFKIIDNLENYKETIAAIEQTNAQLLNAKTNTVMKRFTVLAFLAFPIALTMAFFTVGAVQTATNFDFSLFINALFISLVVDVILLVIFKKKNWL